MKERQLIGMVEYVFQQDKLRNEYATASTRSSEFYDKIVAYATFLNQPLTLGMFVPCDDLGVPIQEPEKTEENQYEWEIYLTAKERVLFYSNLTIEMRNGILSKPRTIEYLTTIEEYYIPTLTESTYNKYFK
jgi:hypothetical protein